MIKALSDYRNRVTLELGLDANTASSDDQALVDEWANDGQEELIKRTKSPQVTDTINLSADTSEYTLTTETFMQILHVKSQGVGGVAYEMEPIGMDELLGLQTRQPVTNSPVKFYSFAGFDKFHVWPTPDSAEVLDVLHLPRPTLMTAAGDNPDSIPVEWHDLITEYVLWKAARLDDDSTSGFGQSYQQEWERGIIKMKKQIRLQGSRRLSDAVVGRRNKRVRSNDTYPRY